MEVESTRWSEGEPIAANRGFPALGPTLREKAYRPDVHFTAIVRSAAGEEFAHRVTILGKTRTILTVKEAWRAHALQYEAAVLRKKVQSQRVSAIVQTTPEDYDRTQLSPLRAYRLARFLTYTSPKLENSYHHPVSINTITERGGKLRSVSSHPSYLAHFSRCIAKHLLPILKDIAVTRDSLRNYNITLKNRDQRSRLYSADLDKASDWIDHKVGRSALRGMLQGAGLSPPEVETAMRCLEPYRIVTEEGDEDNGAETTRGAHMGLGTTWTVLSIMNFFAARAAGVPDGSFRICGDDLIGLWTPEQVRFYEQALSDLGLKINKTKCFMGVRGVFCEKLLWITSSDRRRGNVAEQTGTQDPTLRECWPETEYMDPTHAERLANIHSSASVPQPIRSLCGIAMSSRCKWKGLTRGPAAFGGSGHGRLNAMKAKESVKAFLIKGPMSVYRGAGTSILADRTEKYRFERTTNPQHGRTTYEEVLVSEMMSDRNRVVNKYPDLKSRLEFWNRVDAMCPRTGQGPKIVFKKDQGYIGNKRTLSPEEKEWSDWCRQKHGRPIHNYSYVQARKRWLQGIRGISMIDAIRGSRYINAKTRYRLLKIERSELRDNSAIWQSKIGRLAKSTPVQYIPTEVLRQYPTDPEYDQFGQRRLHEWEEGEAKCL
jgi:hypothetical protein